MAQNNRPAVSGPWTYEPEIKRVLSSIRLPDAERNITICLMGRAFSAEVTESNGRLLAAAPALRDALDRLIRAAKNSNCDSLAIDEAIETLAAI